MLHLDLTPDEVAILEDLLTNDLSDLRMEIAHTDRLDYRERLKLRKAVLTKVLEALGPSATAGAE
ncbi:MAG: hypothetical protein AMS20_14765 [Gemmatimonas sp. SG8_28]|jgi:hypothetical protein|nr:MAG: hypothetical protein AMS20_14765 [Gemmatimonas sp. SG8_28]